MVRAGRMLRKSYKLVFGREFSPFNTISLNNPDMTDD